MGGFRSAQVGFRSSWAGVGPLVLVGGRGFARHGPPRVLGLVVVAKNESVFFSLFGFFFFVVVVVGGVGDCGGCFGCWWWFQFVSMDFLC